MRRSRISTLAVAALAILGLAGCAGTVVVYEPVGQQIYQDGDFETAALNGEIQTRVYGAPSSQDPRQIAKATFKAMYGANRGPAVDFTDTPTKGGSGGFHVVILYNPKFAAATNDSCYEPQSNAGTPGRGEAVLVAAFCFNDMLLSTASGQVSGVASVDDPAFTSLVKQVTHALFPAYDGVDRGGDAIPG